MLQNELFFSYVSEAEKDIMALESEFNIEMAKASLALEYADRMYEIRTMQSDLKVLNENGTYEDLDALYEAAGAEAEGSKQGVIATIIQKLKTFLANIGESLQKRFGKAKVDELEKAVNEGKVPQNTEVKVKDPTKVLEAAKKAVGDLGKFLKPGVHTTNEDGEKVLSIANTFKTAVEGVAVVALSVTMLPKAISNATSLFDRVKNLGNDVEKASGDEKKSGLIQKIVSAVQTIASVLAKQIGNLQANASGVLKKALELGGKAVGTMKNIGKKKGGEAPAEEAETTEESVNDVIEESSDEEVTSDIMESCNEIIDLIDNL